MTQEQIDLREVKEELKNLKAEFEKFKNSFDFVQDMKRETNVWDKLSDEALENFENSIK